MKGVLLNRMAIIGGHRISRDASRIVLNMGRSKEDTTTWEDKSERYELGRWTGDFNMAGRAADALEARFLGELELAATPSHPTTIFLANGNGSPGGLAAMMDGCAFDYSVGGEQGRMPRFELSGAAQDRGMIGEILESSIGTVGITGAQDGTAVELGALTEDQELVVVYHLLHFPAAEGTNPTLDAKIQSATDQAFTTPVDRIVLPQRTGTPVGSVHRLSGPVTDTWWRFVVTAVGGTATPKLWVVVTAAIVAK